jgi:hypothetical protein
MVTIKQHNSLSLVDVLRSLVGIGPSTRIHLNKPKVVPRGARPAPVASAKRGTGKEIFGQRKNCSSYTGR